MGERLHVTAVDEPWDIDLDEVARKIREHWPSVHIERARSIITGNDYLAFTVDLEGMTRHGKYSRSGLSLEDGPPVFWAETIAWFLRLLPPGSQALCFLDSAPEHRRPLPPDSTPEQIIATFTELEAAAWQ